MFFLPGIDDALFFEFLSLYDQIWGNVDLYILTKDC